MVEVEVMTKSGDAFVAGVDDAELDGLVSMWTKGGSREHEAVSLVGADGRMWWVKYRDIEVISYVVVDAAE